MSFSRDGPPVWNEFGPRGNEVKPPVATVDCAGARARPMMRRDEITSMAPKSRRRIGTSSELDVVNAIRAAQRIQSDWARVPVAERANRFGFAIPDPESRPARANESEAEIARAGAPRASPPRRRPDLPRVQVLRTLLPWASSLLSKAILWWSNPRRAERG